MYIACEKCKWNYEGECDFYSMGSGDEIDMPCYRERYKEILEEAQEERQMGIWIPCSERLPEENGRYLVTNSAWGAMEVDWNAWVNGAWLYPNTKPIAWMPLPEPYKADKVGEE